MGTGTAQPGDRALHGHGRQRWGARADEGSARGITIPSPLLPAEKEIIAESCLKLKFSVYPVL